MKQDTIINETTPGVAFNAEKYIKKAKAMEMLGFSRHTFDKCVKGGVLVATTVGRATYFLKSDIDKVFNLDQSSFASISLALPIIALIWSLNTFDVLSPTFS